MIYLEIDEVLERKKIINPPGPASTGEDRPPSNPAIRVCLPPRQMILLSRVFENTHLYGIAIYQISLQGQRAKAPSTEQRKKLLLQLSLYEKGT